MLDSTDFTVMSAKGLFWTRLCIRASDTVAVQPDRTTFAHGLGHDVEHSGFQGIIQIEVTRLWCVLQHGINRCVSRRAALYQQISPRLLLLVCTVELTFDDGTIHFLAILGNSMHSNNSFHNRWVRLFICCSCRFRQHRPERRGLDTHVNRCSMLHPAEVAELGGWIGPRAICVCAQCRWQITSIRLVLDRRRWQIKRQRGLM